MARKQYTGSLTLTGAGNTGTGTVTLTPPVDITRAILISGGPGYAAPYPFSSFPTLFILEITNSTTVTITGKNASGAVWSSYPGVYSFAIDDDELAVSASGRNS